MTHNTILLQPNAQPSVKTFQQHSLLLPSCCPVSGNPAPGSWISIAYRAGDGFLEVYSLKKYIDTFIGGQPEGVRDMEGMIQQIAQECANVLGVYVRADALVRLQQGGALRIVAKARPR